MSLMQSIENLINKEIRWKGTRTVSTNPNQ